MIKYSEFLSFAQVANFLRCCGSSAPTLILGETGIGKTAIYKYMQTFPEFSNHIFLNKAIDCTHLSDGSVWMPDIDREKGVSRELPNERFGISKNNRRGVNGSRPIVGFLDEMTKSAQYIKNILASVFNEHAIGQDEFPEGSVIAAAGNLSMEGLGDMLQAHLRSRLTILYMRKPTAPELINWGMDNNMHPMMLAYLDKHPDTCHSFLDYEKGGKHEGLGIKSNPKIFNPKESQDAFASPRTLNKVSTILNDGLGKLDDDTLQAAMAGTAGVPFASEFGAFLRFGQDLISYEVIVKDPKKAPIAENPIAQLVQVMQCVSRTQSRAEAEAVTVYIDRMKEEIEGVFCNTVANSPRIPHFMTVPSFSALLEKHRIYYTK